MSKPIIECLHDYVWNFPELKDGALLVDFLGNEAVEYTVEAVPCDPVYKRYVDGDCQKQFLFIFASRESYSEDVNLCISNLGFYEKFEDWINDNNESGALPDLGEDKTPVSLDVLTRGYAFDADANTARYQIQLRLIYEED